MVVPGGNGGRRLGSSEPGGSTGAGTLAASSLCAWYAVPSTDERGIPCTVLITCAALPGSERG